MAQVNGGPRSRMVELDSPRAKVGNKPRDHGERVDPLVVHANLLPQQQQDETVVAATVRRHIIT